VDLWNQDDCISWVFVVILRRQKSGSREETVAVKWVTSGDLAGYLSVPQLLSFRAMRYLDCSREDILRVFEVKVGAGRKQRFAMKQRRGILRAKCNQEHSGAVTLATNDADLLQEVLLGRGRPIQPVVFHGTKLTHARSIWTHSLFPGGLAHRRRRRKHVHMVVNINGVTDGIRSGSEVSVAIDVFELLQAGRRIFRSGNKVYLTEGVGDAGIPPAFLVGIERLSNNTTVYAHPAVPVDATGRPIIRQSLRRAIIASNETAAAILAAAPNAMDMKEDAIPEPMREPNAEVFPAEPDPGSETEVDRSQSVAPPGEDAAVGPAVGPALAVISVDSSSSQFAAPTGGDAAAATMAEAPAPP
jgi:RNA:NAD 2'-phosphotransferase (TPT1/KptA family)